MKSPKRLSFKGCSRLERLNLSYLDSLEVLNLSGTTHLKDFWFVTHPDAHPLRRWDMVPINYDGVQDALFEGLNLDDNDTGARIWVSDGDIFKKVSRHIFNAKCFSRFHVRISSSTEEKPNMPMPMGNSQHINFQRSQFAYQDMYCHIQSCLFPNFRRTFNRHLEIFRSKVESLHPLGNLLGHVELLTLFDNSYVKSLTKGLDDAATRRLRECRIGSCQRMEIIFERAYSEEFIIECLEVMWVSDLPKLTVVCNYYHPGSFGFLKHINLERCPKLVTVFASGYHFECVETLEIKFCSRLQVVFGDEGEAGGGSFPKLQSLCLWQLPKLKSICGGYLPKLQKMRVRGCRKLRKLPLQVRNINNKISHDAYDVGFEVQIEGEMNWWDNLQWEDDASSTKRSVRFRACGRVPVKERK